MDFPNAKYEVFIIKEGSGSEKSGQFHGSTGITLVLGPHILLVGTGLPKDKQLLINGLSEKNVKTESVEYVVCPYGHVETTGNLNLFPSATHIVGFHIMKGDHHVGHEFRQEIPYEIDDDLEVIATPGMFQHVVSVLCRNTPLGTVAIAGGAFHNEEDLETPEHWVDQSLDADTQQEGRIHILREAHYIVPRYGPIYRVPDCYKSTTVAMVITP